MVQALPQHHVRMEVFEGPEWTDASEAPTEPGPLHTRLDKSGTEHTRVYLAGSKPTSRPKPVTGDVVRGVAKLGPEAAALLGPFAATGALTFDVARTMALTPDKAHPPRGPWTPRTWYLRLDGGWGGRACPVEVELHGP